MVNNTLVLFWEDATTQYAWQWFENGEAQSQGLDSLEAIYAQLPLTGLYRCNVIIPSTSCLSSVVQVPQGAAHKITAALPFLMEDKLIEEPEAFFIVPLAKKTPQEWQVVAILAQKLQTIIQTCREARIEPDAVIPMALLLPYQTGQISFYINEDVMTVRYEEAMGLQCERDHMSLVFNLLQQKEDIQQKSIHLWCHKNEKEGMLCQLQGLMGESGVIHEVEDEKRFWAEASLSCPYHLLHREFAPKRKRTPEIKRYRWAGALLIAWLSVTLMGTLFQYRYFKTHFLKSQAAIEREYHVLFPEATRIVNPKQTFQRELDKLNQTKKQGDFLYVMMDMALGLTEFPGVVITSMDYKKPEWMLILTAEDFSQVKALTEKLQQHGLDVKQESATRQKDHVDVRLQIRKRNNT